MKRQDVRTIVASESPHKQFFLRDLIEGTGEAVIVGQARDASEALTLARNIRPDVAVVDCFLPYVYGSSGLPLSRTGGLDAAQAISDEMPNVRIILVTNLDSLGIDAERAGFNGHGRYSIVSQGSDISLTSRSQGLRQIQPKTFVFADIQENAEAPLRLSDAKLWEKALLFGGLGIFAGWLLILTVMLAQAGIAIAALGGAAVLFGLGSKAVMSRRERARRKEAGL
ncbi:MAG: hypothetical protein HYX83_03380 [Chloroflexi bacterium]|nr:hypothetical protein [Chloroflexota bacterium]